MWRPEEILLCVVDPGLSRVARPPRGGCAEGPQGSSKAIAELEGKGSSVEKEVEKLYEMIDAKVKELNNQFAPPEQVRKFTILPRDFSVDHGELTPTLKIRRADS